MATQYNIEPPPKGQCVLHTSSGDLLLELFAQQTPIACRNFLQLILNGYYSNTIFHRLVPDFIIQGGDPTGTGSGGESSYHGGAPFADEFHPRLKFNRRGLLGMANSGTKDDNGSQFFLTLGKCDELTGRHTMFGRVVGNTIFNLVKMGEAELVDGEASERPLYPITITGAEVIENPFDGMSPQRRIAQATQEEDYRPKKRQRKKTDRSKLSFMAEDGEDYDRTPNKSAPKFNQAIIEPALENTRLSQSSEHTIQAKPVSHRRETGSPSPIITQSIFSDIGQASKLEKGSSDSESPTTVSPILRGSDQLTRVNGLLEKTNAQISELRSSLKRENLKAPAIISNKTSTLEALIPASATRGRKRGAGFRSIQQEQRTLDAFNAFKQRLEVLDTENRNTHDFASIQSEDTPAHTFDRAHEFVKEASSTIEQDEEAELCDLHFIADCQSCINWANKGDSTRNFGDEDGANWMSHSLSFAKDRLGKSLEWKRKNEEELLVIDPREKAKIIREEGRKKSSKEDSR